MNGNKRGILLLGRRRNLKIHEYSLIQGSCHTPSDGSPKYPDLWKTRLIGMQDLTPNKLFRLRKEERAVCFSWAHLWL